MKKVLFLLFFALGSVASLGQTTFSYTSYGNTLYYEIIDAVNHTCGAVYDNSYADLSGNLIIPESVTYNDESYSVVELMHKNKGLFEGVKGLTSVSIPNSVTSIGDNAFDNCDGLTSVTIGKSVTYIGNFAFQGCNLTSLTIKAVEAPKTEFGTFDNGQTDFPLYVPQGCVDAYKHAGFWAWFTNIQESTYELYYEFDDENHTATVYGDKRLYFVAISHSGFSDELSIPSTIDYNNEKYQVTTIGNSAFENHADIITAVIPNSVTSIGNWAFEKCYSLTSVTIPNSVTSIGDNAFDGCESLTSVTIGNSVTSIGKSAFYGCSDLTNVVIPNSVTSIGKYAFYRVPIVVYGGSATGSPWGAKLHYSALQDGIYYQDYDKTIVAASVPGLTEVDIPEGVLQIADNVFLSNKALTRITFPNSLTSIGNSVFKYCHNLTSVTIPNSVTRIGNSAFFECVSLTSLTIPNSVTSIGEDAFYRCNSLTSVVIGKSVTNIGNYAFFNTYFKTVYNLSGLSIEKGSKDNGFVAWRANRVVNCTTTGSGANAIAQIPDTYSFVDVEDDVETHIPESSIPTNFIYNDGGSWKAKNIVLTDCQDAFETYTPFTADKANYSREISSPALVASVTPSV